MRLSNSKIKTWRRCPNKYRYKYVEKLRPKQKAVQLERGTWIHDLLQHYYDGEGWKARHKELTKNFNNLFDEEKEDLGNLPDECERIMRSYLRHYKDEDKSLIVVDSELDEIVPLEDGTEFNFIIDLVVEEDGGLWLWDHKTVKNFMDEDFMLVDAQLTRYFACAEQMGYTPLKGVLFNELRTKAPGIPQLIQDGSRLSRAKIDTDYRTFLRAIREHDLDPADYRKELKRLKRQPNNFFRRTRLPKDRVLTEQLMREATWTAREIAEAEEREEFPRSPDKACTWDCEYYDICVTELMGGDPSSIIKNKFERRRRGE